MDNDFPNIPPNHDMKVAKDLIKATGIDLDKYISLLNMLNESNEFMTWLRLKLAEPFADDPDALYRDVETLLRCRDYLCTLKAQSTAYYRIAKKSFSPKTGTAYDKLTEKEAGSAPYKFYEGALDDRIKTLDNRCTAAKQQQRIIEEAIKRNLIE